APVVGRGAGVRSPGRVARRRAGARSRRAPPPPPLRRRPQRQEGRMTILGHMPPAADIETILADPGGACPDCVRIVIEGFRAEVERLRTELDETTAARDGDLVRQLAEAWRERDAARAEVERLRVELATVRREAHRDRLAANGAIDRID